MCSFFLCCLRTERGSSSPFSCQFPSSTPPFSAISSSPPVRTPFPVSPHRWFCHIPHRAPAVDEPSAASPPCRSGHAHTLAAHWLRPVGMGCQRPQLWAGWAWPGLTGHCDLGPQWVHVNSAIWQLFKVYLIEIQINSNLFQIQLKLVQTWKLDQITSNLWILVIILK
jgi:hypothetical protein